MQWRRLKHLHQALPKVIVVKGTQLSRRCAGYPAGLPRHAAYLKFGQEKCGEDRAQKPSRGFMESAHSALMPNTEPLHFVRHCFNLYVQ